jgi:hypothetical protein
MTVRQLRKDKQELLKLADRCSKVLRPLSVSVHAGVLRLNITGHDSFNDIMAKYKEELALARSLADAMITNDRELVRNEQLLRIPYRIFS